MCKKPYRPPAKTTLHHQLNHCPSFLGEAIRFTQRHDSVLTHMAESLKESLPDNITV